MTKLLEFDRLSDEIDALNEDIDGLHYMVTKKDTHPKISFNDFSVQKPIVERSIKCIKRLARKSDYHDLKIENELEENLLSFSGNGIEYAYLRRINKFVGEWNFSKPFILANLISIQEVYGLQSCVFAHADLSTTHRLSNRLRNLEDTLSKYKALLKTDEEHCNQILLEKISEIVEVALFCLESCFIDLSIKINQILELADHSLLLTQYPEKFPNLVNLEHQKTLHGQKSARVDEIEDASELDKPLLKNLPPKILLLDKLGFFKLPEVQKLSYESKGKLISALCGGSADNAVDYIRQCDPNRISLEKNPYRNPSNLAAVSKLLKSIDSD